MTVPTLRGERVTLRPARPGDAEHLVRWANDADFAWNQWGRGPGRFRDAEAARTQFIERFALPDGALFVIEHDGRPIGFANYRDTRAKPKSAEVGIGIGERALWSKGLGRDALRALVRHLVDDLGLHRITLLVMSYNDRAINSYRALGFEVEGVLKDAVMTDRGGWGDSVAMAYIVGRTAPAFDPRPVTLAGRHVRLEPLRMEHATGLFSATNDEDTWRYLSVGPPKTVADTEAYVRSALDLQIRGEHMP